MSPINNDSASSHLFTTFILLFTKWSTESFDTDFTVVFMASENRPRNVVLVSSTNMNVKSDVLQQVTEEKSSLLSGC